LKGMYSQTRVSATEENRGLKIVFLVDGALHCLNFIILSLLSWMNIKYIISVYLSYIMIKYTL